MPIYLWKTKDSTRCTENVGLFHLHYLFNQNSHFVGLHLKCHCLFNLRLLSHMMNVTKDFKDYSIFYAYLFINKVQRAFTVSTSLCNDSPKQGLCWLPSFLWACWDASAGRGSPRWCAFAWAPPSTGHSPAGSALRRCSHRHHLSLVEQEPDLAQLVLVLQEKEKEGGDCPTLLCTGAASPWILSAVLGTTTEEGYKALI